MTRSVTQIKTVAELRRLCETATDEQLRAAGLAAAKAAGGEGWAALAIYAQLDKRIDAAQPGSRPTAAKVYEDALGYAKQGFKAFGAPTLPPVAANEYDPNNIEHRRQLAEALMSMLDQAGFKRDGARTRKELVYSRRVTNREGAELAHTDVVVYTSIENGVMREVDSDAIRVCAIFQAPEKQGRGLFKDARVFRTGTIEGVVERTKQRMRNAWDHAKHIERCSYCGAPTFMSRNNKRVCAAICWEKKAS